MANAGQVWGKCATFARFFHTCPVLTVFPSVPNDYTLEKTEGDIFLKNILARGKRMFLQRLRSVLCRINLTGLRLNLGGRATVADIAEAVRWELEHT